LRIGFDIIFPQSPFPLNNRSASSILYLHAYFLSLIPGLLSLKLTFAIFYMISGNESKFFPCSAKRQAWQKKLSGRQFFDRIT